MTLAVSAATRVSCVNRPASSGESHSLRRAAVILQGPEYGVLVVQITAVVKAAGAIAAQVVAVRGQCANAIRSIARNYTVLECHTGPLIVGDTAAAIPAGGAIADNCSSDVGDTATPCVIGTRNVPANGAVVEHQIPVIKDPTAVRDTSLLPSSATPYRGPIPAHSAVVGTRPANTDRDRNLLTADAPLYSYRPWSLHMDFHKIWEEQCEATRAIRERFGVENALDYLVGEKLVNFAKAADQDPDFAAELPRFQAEVREIFNVYELRGYVAGLRPAARKKLQALLYVSP